MPTLSFMDVDTVARWTRCTLLPLVLASVGLVRVATAQTSPDVLQPLPENARWNDYTPTWTPDGDAIVFNSQRAGGTRLYKVDITSGDVTPFLPIEASHSGGAFSPDGREFAISMWDDNGARVNYAYNLDTGDTRVLLDASWEALSVQWSPDGGWLLFNSARYGNNDIWMMRTDGSETRRLTTHPADDYGPAFSPDGTKIVFESRRNGDPDIYVLDLENDVPRRLTAQGGYHDAPSWSPDGRRIVFWANQYGARDYDVYSMTPDGLDVRQLTHSRDWNWGPEYSPDGQWVAFNSRRDGNRGIYIMRPDGSDVRKLTNRRQSEFVEVACRDGIKEALRRLEASRQADPDAQYFLPAEGNALVHELIDAGKIDRAVELAELNWSLHPADGAVTSELIDAWRAEGRETPPKWTELAYAFRSLGFDEGWRLYHESLDRFPDWEPLSGGMLRSLASGFRRRGIPAKALHLHRADVEAHPEAAPAWAAHAWALDGAGQRDEALDAADQALGLDPDHASARRLRQRLGSTQTSSSR